MMGAQEAPDPVRLETISREIEAEQALLGRLMTPFRGVPCNVPRIPARRFASPRHQLIYRAIADQATRSKPYDLTSILAVLKERGHLEDAGGHAYLGNLQDAAGPVASLDYYLERINHAAARKAIVTIGRGMQQLADGDPDDARPVDARFRSLLTRAERMAGYSVNGHRPGALRASSLGEIMRAPSEPIPWAITPWLARGDVTCLAGEWGLGKSWAALDLAFALTFNRPWLSSIPVEGGPYRVMYVDEENNPRLVAFRVRRLVDGFDLGLNDADVAPLRYYTENRLNLDDPASLKGLIAEVRAFRPDFIILDSLVRFHHRDENSNADMAAFQATAIRPLRAESGAGIVMIHHLAKATRERPASQLGARIRGASDIPAAMDQVWGLEPQDDAMRLRHVKCRWADTASPLGLTLEDVHGGNGVRLIAGRADTEAKDAILEAIRDAGTTGLSRPRILAILSEEGIKSDDRVATRALGKLYTDGLVRKAKDGKIVTYWTSESAPPEAT